MQSEGRKKGLFHLGINKRTFHLLLVLLLEIGSFETLHLIHQMKGANKNTPNTMTTSHPVYEEVFVIFEWPVVNRIHGECFRSPKIKEDCRFPF